MSEAKIQEYARTKGFHPQVQQRWLNWSPEDGAALLDVALAVKASENHMRDLMDWLEEIAIRDGIAIRKVLESKAIVDIKTDPRLGRSDRLKRIKDKLRRLRFPRLSQIEDSIQSKIRDLKLQPGIKLSPPPALEGGCLQIEFSAGSPAELKSLLGKLNAAADSQALAEIFVLLRGGAETARPTAAP